MADVTGGSTGTSSSEGSGSSTTTGVEPIVCDGGALRGDVFDPNEVYVVGTLQEGACGRDVVAHWSSMDDAVAGFSCNFAGNRGAIRPGDGRLVYADAPGIELREFHCDACPVDSALNYPSPVLDNDPVLPAPACKKDGSSSLFFRLGPDGEYAYQCNFNPNDWYDGSGALVFSDEDESLIRLGHDRLALTGSSVVELDTGTRTPISGLPAGIISARADPSDGFRVVVNTTPLELWHVAPDGNADLVGTFPPLPDGHQALATALDGCDALYRVTFIASTGLDAVVRQPLDGVAEIVFTESDDSLVRIHDAGLFTGP